MFRYEREYERQLGIKFAPKQGFAIAAKEPDGLNLGIKDGRGPIGINNKHDSAPARSRFARGVRGARGSGKHPKPRIF